MNESDRELSIGQCATLACILEATAPKPGNVHRGADFDDLSYPDFLLSGVAIGPVLDLAAGRSLGRTVLEAVQATRRLVDTNSNLGMVLLLAPLAAVARPISLQVGVAEILKQLTADDAALVYQAINAARPGGMGQVATADLNGPPPTDLRAAMALASDRDLVARQYANDFAEVFGAAVPFLIDGIKRDWPLNAAIVHAHLRLMNQFPDSLIARKAGPALAREAAAHAGQVLDAGRPGEANYEEALADLDFWLRCDGHRRNPGTTADLLAAALFVALRDGLIKPPFKLTSLAEAP